MDSVLRANYSTRANGALPASGEVSCAVSVDGPLELAGITIGLPDSYWASIEPAVRPSCRGTARLALRMLVGLQMLQRRHRRTHALGWTAWAGCACACVTLALAWGWGEEGYL